MQTDLKDIVDYHVLTCIQTTIRRSVNRSVQNSCVDSVKTVVAANMYKEDVETAIWSGVLQHATEFVDERQ